MTNTWKSPTPSVVPVVPVSFGLQADNHSGIEFARVLFGVRSSRRSFRRWLFGPYGLAIIEIIVVVGVWQGVTSLGLISPLEIAQPSSVARAFAEGFVTKRYIYGDLLTSGEEFLIGFLLGTAIGIALGLAMGLIESVKRICEPIVMFLYAIPQVAFLSLLIIWFGIGLKPKVFLIFAGVVFTMAINTEAGVRNIDPSLTDMARAFGTPKAETLRKVVLPGSFPFVLAGLRLSVGRALIMLVVAEMYAANKGVGFLIINAGNSYDTPVLIEGVIILSVISVFASSVLKRAERKVTSWRKG